MQAIASGGLNLLYPIRCVNCDSIGARFCADCLLKIQWIEHPFCPHCGNPGEPCSAHTCIDPHVLFQIRSAALFTGPIRQALHALKYRRDQSVASQLVERSLEHLPVPFWQVDLLLPVPMGKQRFRERGYNQAELLARSLSEKTGIRMDGNLLVRTRDTRSQVGLTLTERQQNLDNAFDAKPVAGKSILLIDDVCTTGSTLVACAHALQNAGAETTYAVTIARAVPVHRTGTRAATPIPQGEAL
jgi:competence protein ComFC